MCTCKHASMTIKCVDESVYDCSLYVETSVTHQALSLKASGMSGLTITVELNKAERDMPPKSDKRAPLMATTGCPEPSNFSACRKKKKKGSKTVIAERAMKNKR